MIEPQTTTLLLLAAGRSTRFGDVSKLTVPWRGVPLGLHAAAALEPIAFARRIAVVSHQEPDYRAAGFEVVMNEAPDQGLSRSIQMGVGAARTGRPEAILIALADMPRLTAAHISRLFTLAQGASTIAASSDGTNAQPPALFGTAWFDRLEQIEGDRGARDLLRAASIATADPDELVDIDTFGDLDRLHARFGK